MLTFKQFMEQEDDRPTRHRVFTILETRKLPASAGG